MNSPFSIIYEAMLTRLTNGLGDNIRQINIDLGQMENYNPGNGGKPKISLPAILIDFEAGNFTNEAEATQKGELSVVVRACFEQVSATDSLTPEEVREKGLEYFDIEWLIHKLLQDWTPGDGYGRMARTSTATENRPDHYRVRQMRYRLNFRDKSTQLSTSTANLVVPDTVITVEVQPE